MFLSDRGAERIGLITRDLPQIYAEPTPYAVDDLFAGALLVIQEMRITLALAMLFYLTRSYPVIALLRPLLDRTEQAPAPSRPRGRWKIVLRWLGIVALIGIILFALCFGVQALVLLGFWLISRIPELIFQIPGLIGFSLAVLIFLTVFFNGYRLWPLNLLLLVFMVVSVFLIVRLERRWSRLLRAAPYSGPL